MSELSEPLTVELTREPFSTLVTLKTGESSEDLDWEDVREWFKMRGANMDVIEKALDRVYNFYSASVTIKNPRQYKGNDDSQGLLPTL